MTVLRNRYYCISVPYIFGAPITTIWDNKVKVRELYVAIDTEDSFNVVAYDAVSDQILKCSSEKRYNLLEFCKHISGHKTSCYFDVHSDYVHVATFEEHALESIRDLKIITEEEIKKNLEKRKELKE